MTLSDFIDVPVGYLVLVLLASVARFLLLKEPPAWRVLLAMPVSALLTIVAIHPWLSEKELSKGLLTLIVAFISFGAKDILEFLLFLAVQIKKDPLAIVREFLNKIKPPGGSL